MLASLPLTAILTCCLAAAHKGAPCRIRPTPGWRRFTRPQSSDPQRAWRHCANLGPIWVRIGPSTAENPRHLSLVVAGECSTLRCGARFSLRAFGFASRGDSKCPLSKLHVEFSFTVRVDLRCSATEQTIDKSGRDR